MRAVLLLLAFPACTTAPEVPDLASGSLRDQLAHEADLLVIASDSSGAITAQRKTKAGWDQQRVALTVTSGELVTAPGRADHLTLTALELDFAPVLIPSTVLGHDAELTDLHLRLPGPVPVLPTWSSDDETQATTTLDLTLSWTLAIEDNQLPLGAPKLPPIPVVLRLTGDGAVITAELGVHASGELWRWADVIKLSDLELVLRARTHPGEHAARRVRDRCGRVPGSAAGLGPRRNGGACAGQARA
jgi:hypothetical protein